MSLAMLCQASSPGSRQTVWKDSPSIAFAHLLNWWIAGSLDLAAASSNGEHLIEISVAVMSDFDLAD
jgi:hypothetical protein